MKTVIQSDRETGSNARNRILISYILLFRYQDET